MLTLQEMQQLRARGYFWEADMPCARLIMNYLTMPGVSGPFYLPDGSSSWWQGWGGRVWQPDEFASPFRALGHRVIIHKGWFSWDTLSFHAVPERKVYATLWRGYPDPAADSAGDPG